ncbi:MFS transporter, partial [Thermoplasma sp.]|uniref:MFS transporter n=1 Tax=Thermoplasma sp. TaxID=1973142 RepID=UPI00262171EC
MDIENKGNIAEQLVEKNRNKRYQAFLLITAFLGWTMVVYEWNVFGILLGPASQILKINSAQVGYMLSAIQFVMVPIIFAVGYYIDKVGRKLMYQLTLVGASVLTALTGFATYVGIVPLILVRAGTQGTAQNEQSVAASLITEEMPARWRSLLYSFVQSGWPFGVAIAGLVVSYLYKPLGYKYIFLVAVIPMLLVIIARFWAKESVRFEEVKKAREGKIDSDVVLFTKPEKVKKNLFRQAFDVDVRGRTIRSFLLYTFYLAGQVPV